MDDKNIINISIISLVYKGEGQVSTLVDRLSKSVQDLGRKFEIILVEDGSPDRSWEKIEQICHEYSFVKGIKLSRNFGQHYAITAGMQHACGEWIVIMDCDLQDLPEEIPNLYRKSQEGYDIVFARRLQRQDRSLKKFSSYIFYKVFSYLTDTKQDHTIANFGIYNQKVIKAMLAMNDHIRYFPTMSQWVGFSKTTLDVQHSSRDGASSYTFRKLMQLAFNNMIAFSDKPLRLTVQLGSYISIISFIIGIYYLYLYLSGQIKVLGFTSIMISIGLLMLLRPLIRLCLLPAPDRLGSALGDLALCALRRVLAPLSPGEGAVAQERERPLLAVFAPERDWRERIALIPILDPADAGGAAGCPGDGHSGRRQPPLRAACARSSAHNPPPLRPNTRPDWPTCCFARGCSATRPGRPS